MPTDPLVISDDCTACGACLLTCPEHALRPGVGKPWVVAQSCTACGECVEICPADAIDLRANADSGVDPAELTLRLPDAHVARD